MGTKTQSKKIGEHTYSVTQWSATKALTMQIKLAKLLGPMLGALALGKASTKDFMALVPSLLDRLSEQEFLNLIIDLVCEASMDGLKMQKEMFDMYFSENLLAAYEIVAFVLEVNFKDFLSSVRNLKSGLLN